MIAKLLFEIFQAITQDPAIKRILGNYSTNGKSDTDLETLMNDLGLSGEDRAKFRTAHKEFQENPTQTYQKYQYKYEPKSNSAADKFDAYFRKFEDQAREQEEKFGQGTADYSHRQYQKQSSQQQQGAYTHQTPSISAEEKKHLETLELKEGATFEQIKASYKSMMKKYHPDKFQEEERKKYAENISSKINGAYGYFKKKFNQ